MPNNIFAYKNTLLVPRSNGVDVVDSKSGRWFTAKSMRAAKWNASVWARLSSELKATP